MERDELQKRLLASFVEELAGHVASLERDLLALERGDPVGTAELLHALFRTVHTIKGSSRAASVHLVEQATHRIEDLLSPMREGTITPGPAIFELLFGTTDALRDAGERISRGESLDASPLETFIQRLGAVSEPPPTSLAQPSVTTSSGRDNVSKASNARIDALLGTTNELIVAFGRLEAHDRLLDEVRLLASRRDGDLRSVAAAIDRFGSAYESDRRRLALWIRELDGSLKQLRMIRFGEACRGLERAVRDVARASGKEVDLVIEGDDVELDRDVVEGLRDPLLHLVRNAVDHGIEKPAARRAAGKSERGTVRIKATPRGPEAVITIEDDGKGLDVEAIRTGVERRGGEAPARDDDLVQTIFLAGFSTAPLVTDVSGRGVGLDVVKRGIEQLMGAIDLSYRSGAGTRFTLRLPVTRSSMRALLVRSGLRTWAIPGIAVKRLLRVSPDAIKPVAGSDTVAVDGMAVPIVPLSVALGEPSTPLADDVKAPLVIVSAQGTDIALVVDELLEEREIVVKPLGPRLSSSVWVSGATVLPSGRLALVLNIGSVVSRARGLPLDAAIFTTAAGNARTRETKTVLLVDDSLTTRILERSILESAGYLVLVAANGAEAWEMLSTRGADIVVSDVEMPVMDGFVLTETIRKSVRFRDLPVVLVTALSSDEDRARGLDVGASAYLVKSAFDQKNLIDTIGQLL